MITFLNVAIYMKKLLLGIQMTLGKAQKQTSSTSWFLFKGKATFKRICFDLIVAYPTSNYICEKLTMS